MSRRREVVYLTSDIMESLIHQLATVYFSQYGEPIPAYDRHDDHLLESSLALPQQSFDGQELYPTIPAKASAMFYSIIKNHPFSNGNKRLATTALLVFCYLNDQWLESEQAGVYRWAVRVAESDRREQTAVVRQMTRWLEKNLVNRHEARPSSHGLFGRLWNALNWLLPRRPRFWSRR